MRTPEASAAAGETRRPACSNKRIPIDVRVLATTHQDLNQLVDKGKFLQDLLHRPREREARCDSSEENGD